MNYLEGNFHSAINAINTGTAKPNSKYTHIEKKDIAEKSTFSSKLKSCLIKVVTVVAVILAIVTVIPALVYGYKKYKLSQKVKFEADAESKTNKTPVKLDFDSIKYFS